MSAVNLSLRTSDLALLVCVTSLLLWLVVGRRIIFRAKYRLPPGPPQQFFFGKAHDADIQDVNMVRKAFPRWVKEYGMPFAVIGVL
jgi:hypothetical protein